MRFTICSVGLKCKIYFKKWLKKIKFYFFYFVNYYCFFLLPLFLCLKPINCLYRKFVRLTFKMHNLFLCNRINHCPFLNYYHNIVDLFKIGTATKSNYLFVRPYFNILHLFWKLFWNSLFFEHHFKTISSFEYVNYLNFMISGFVCPDKLSLISIYNSINFVITLIHFNYWFKKKDTKINQKKVQWY